MSAFPFGHALTYGELFQTLRDQYRCTVTIQCRPGELLDTDGHPASGLAMCERTLNNGEMIQLAVPYYNETDYVMPSRHRSIFAGLRIDELPPH
jgi:hypothetical protein